MKSLHDNIFDRIDYHRKKIESLDMDYSMCALIPFHRHDAIIKELKYLLSISHESLTQAQKDEIYKNGVIAGVIRTLYLLALIIILFGFTCFLIGV